MKRTLTLLIALMTFASLHGQDVGKVIIKNLKDNFPKFIVSLNGIRLSNEYSATAIFNYLDEYQYKVNILQAGSRNTLTFMVYSAPNYISTYVINKDTYGNYLFNLESKVLMNDSSATAKSGSITSASAITQASLVPGKIIEEEEYFDIIKTLKKEPVEKNRLEMAKTFFSTKWLLASMVADAIKIYKLEPSRVAFAKFAYARTTDKNNYYKVFDSFTLSNSKKEITEYIKVNP